MDRLPNMEILQKYYSGFLISRPVGNNAFSFDKRVNKQIYVPPLVEGSLSDLAVGYHIAFSEIDEGIEFNGLGLAQFIVFRWHDVPVFIFDNHNHAFFFWTYGLRQGLFSPGLPLVHVDQHSDMWKPHIWPAFSLRDDNLLDQAFAYTNFTINVGNFIKPALHLNYFSDITIITGSIDFELTFDGPIVFDLDMDVFAPVMDYIGNPYKIDVIRRWMEQAAFITVATSPFFMNQPLAIDFIRKIFEE